INDFWNFTLHDRSGGRLSPDAQRKPGAAAPMMVRRTGEPRRRGSGAGQVGPVPAPRAPGRDGGGRRPLRLPGTTRPSAGVSYIEKLILLGYLHNRCRFTVLARCLLDFEFEVEQLRPQIGERRFRPLVPIHAGGLEAVTAGAATDIGEGLSQA